MEGMSRKPVSECLGSGLVVHSSFFPLRKEGTTIRSPGPRKKNIEGMGTECDCTREHV